MFTREVWRYVLPLLLLAVLLHYFSVYFAAPVYALVLVVLYIFRLPAADIPSCALCLVSPISGKVLSIEAMFDPYLKRDAVRLTFDSTVFDSYALRSLTEGKVMQYWGKTAGGENPQQKSRAVWIQTDEEDDAVIVMHPGFVKKVHCYVATGERVGLGQQCGSTPFGGTVEVYLPANARVQCKVNDKVLAGKDVIAEWVHAS